MGTTSWRHGWSGDTCDPNAFAGGGGPGTFRLSAVLGDTSLECFGFLHPDAPTVMFCEARHFLKSGASRSASVSLAEYKADFERWEGKVDHMYLDTRGYVTVGIGQMLPSADEAKKLAFVQRDSGSLATADEISADFKSVSGQTSGKLASSYKKYTKLQLPEAETDRLLSTRVAEFEADLRALYSGYDTFPAPAKRALMDMIYNLGEGGLRKFKKFKASVDARDWTKAAGECHRNGPSEERNTWTRDLLLEAARHSP